MKVMRILAILSCVVLMIAGNVHIDSSWESALANTDQVVTELEPNDEPLSAQVIPFPEAGQSVSVHADVSPYDAGGFSEELEIYYQVGKIEDWYVADPDQLGYMGDGPIPIRITVSWDGGADLDVYAGTTVDEMFFYFDGYKNLSGWRASSTWKPESWPARGDGCESVAIYLQPRGMTVGGEPLLNDGYGRKLMIGVKNYAGPRAEYTLTIENGAGLGKTGFLTERHQIDDGGATTLWWVDPYPPGGIIMNRYRPGRYPADLIAVSHPFAHFSSLPDPTGHEIRVIILKGNSDRYDSKPPRITPENTLFDDNLVVPGTISPSPGSYIPGASIDLEIDPITVDSGVVFVGFQWPLESARENGIGIASDESPAQYGRTFLSLNDGQTWGRPVGVEDLTGVEVLTNAAVRAVFAYGEEGTGGSFSNSSSPKSGYRGLRPVRVSQKVVSVR